MNSGDCQNDKSAAATIYTGVPDFCDGTDGDEEYAYNANGNMTMDANKGISSVLYNSLNLPAETSFDSGTYVREWREASGRLRRLHVRAADTGFRLRPQAHRDSREATMLGPLGAPTGKYWITWWVLCHLVAQSGCQVGGNLNLC